MPANLSPEYKAAEAAFRKVREPRERLERLREMLRAIPKHKGTDLPPGRYQAPHQGTCRRARWAQEGRRGADRAGRAAQLRQIVAACAARAPGRCALTQIRARVGQIRIRRPAGRTRPHGCGWRHRRAAHLRRARSSRIGLYAYAPGLLTRDILQAKAPAYGHYEPTSRPE